MTKPSETIFYKTLSLGADSSLQRRFMVLDEQLPGNVRFGLLLEILDKVAEETALNYVKQYYPEARVVTAAIDNILIRHAVDVTRDLTFAATINHIGHTSLEVGIRMEQPNPDGTPDHVASCYFTMVARSGEGADCHHCLQGFHTSPDVSRRSPAFLSKRTKNGTELFLNKDTCVAQNSGRPQQTETSLLGNTIIIAREDTHPAYPIDG